MLLIVCFFYCFFAIVLGMYLGLELISVRKAERMARTIVKAAQATRDQAAQVLPDSGPSSPGEPNYFNMK